MLKGSWQNYISENKLDGTRCLLVKHNNQINLISRSNNDYTEKYPEIIAEAQDMQDTILDGELTFYNGEGKDVFLTSLATKETIREYGVKPCLMIFDILQFNGVNVQNEPLMKRKEYLKGVINPYWKNIKLLEWHEDAIKLWEMVVKEDREGIILKHKQSLYVQNYRSKYWIKTKNFKETEMFFDDYETNNKGITLTNIDGYRVQCAGEQSIKVLEILERDKKVRCKIQYLQKTKGNKLRFLSFRGAV